MAAAMADVMTASASTAAWYDYRTLDEAKCLARELSGFACDTSRLFLGLLELMVNAVEHGNLEIGFDAKASLLARDAWEEEINRRLKLKRYAGRRATVEMTYLDQGLSFTVANQGAGFDPAPFLSTPVHEQCGPNGRGLWLAKTLAFQTLSFDASGCCVQAVFSEH